MSSNPGTPARRSVDAATALRCARSNFLRSQDRAASRRRGPATHHRGRGPPSAVVVAGDSETPVTDREALLAAVLVDGADEDGPPMFAFDLPAVRFASPLQVREASIEVPAVTPAGRAVPVAGGVRRRGHP